MQNTNIKSWDNNVKILDKLQASSFSANWIDNIEILDKNIKMLDNIQACWIKNIKLFRPHDKNIKLLNNIVKILDNFQACRINILRFLTKTLRFCSISKPAHQ